MTGGARPRDLPAGPGVRAVLLTALLDSVGTGLFLAGSVVFFTRSVGLGAAQIGIGLTAAGAVGFAAGVPLGALGDRVGARPVVVGLHLCRALSLAGLAFAHGPVSFVVCAAGQAVGDSAAPPLMQAVVAVVAGDERRLRTMAVLRTVRNVGFSLGALLATPLLAAQSGWGYRSIVLGDAVSFVFAAVLLARLRLAGGWPAPTAGRDRRGLGRSPARRSPARRRLGWRRLGWRGLGWRGLGWRRVDWRYLGLAALNSVLCLHMTLLSVAIPLWTLRATRAPVGVVPLLVLLNTVLAVLLQVPLSAGSRQLAGAVRALRRAGLALAGCCALVAVAGVLPRWSAAGALVLATVLLTLGELWQSGGAWAVSYEFAPAHARVRYLSVFGLGVTVQDVAGPAVLTAGVVAAGWPAWFGLAAVFLLAVRLVRPVTGALAARWPAPALADRDLTMEPVGTP
jgi:MFS family permease